MLCYAMLCYAMLCYAMLCYAMLCYAMLCYAMLCYAMLWYATKRMFPCRWPNNTPATNLGGLPLTAAHCLARSQLLLEAGNLVPELPAGTD
jgi:hypothetical protein